MKESIKWILGALALVVLVAGAYLLYDKLAPEFAPDQLTEVPPASGLDNAPVPDAPPAPDGDTPVEPETPDTPSDDTPSDEPPSDDAPPAGEHTTVNRVPDFTVLDGEGNERKLSEFFGKPIVINFWATWCGYCVQEMPDFDQAAKDHPEVIFMMVNVTDGKRETMEKAKAFIAEQGFTFPVYYDTQYSAAMAYGVSSLPTTYFFDAEGYGVAYAIGAISKEDLLRGIGMITE